MKKILAVYDSRNGKAVAAIENISTRLAEFAEVEKVDLAGSPGLENAKADMVCVFGGDGSLLRTVGHLGANQLPIVGVNVGRLGFLTEFSEDEFLAAIPDILSGKCEPSRRMMLDVRLERGGKELANLHALNEAVLVRLNAIQMIGFSVTIDGTGVTEVQGDGVMVATPTGSTAYSLSAGGSIVAPGTEAMCVTPVNPHTVTSRPLVVCADCVIEIKLLTDRGGVILSLDGQGDREVLSGDLVKVARSQRRCLLIENRNYYETLKIKLNWGGSATYGKN